MTCNDCHRQVSAGERCSCGTVAPSLLKPRPRKPSPRHPAATAPAQPTDEQIVVGRNAIAAIRADLQRARKARMERERAGLL